MEGVLFHEIIANEEAGTADAESSYITPPSSQKEAPIIAPDPVEEYVPLFGTKENCAAEASTNCTDQSLSIVLQDDVTKITSVPKEVIVTGQSTSLVLQDGETNLLGTSSDLIEENTGLPEDISLEGYQLSVLLEDDGSVSAESVEGRTANDASEPIRVKDLIRLMQEGNRKKYQLREINRNSFRGSGWKDTDISGDYDPNIKSIKTLPSQKVKPQRSTRREDGEDEPVPKRHQYRALNYEQGRKTGQRITIKLKLLTEKGLGDFRKLAEEYPSLHDPAFGISERDDNIQDLSHGKSTGVKTRSRQDISSNRPDGNYEHLLGHSEARGCRACYGLGIDCSLVEYGQIYPCDHCREDSTDCALLIPPKFKRACERCKHKRTGCSYSQGGGVGAATCEKCQSGNVECIAGPAKSFRIDDILDSVGNNKSQSRSAAKRKSLPRDSSHQNGTPGSITEVTTYRGGSLATSAIPLPRIRNAPSEKEPKLRAQSKRQVPKKRARKDKSVENNKTGLSRGKEAIKQKGLATTAQRQNRKPRAGVSARLPPPINVPTIEGGRILHITTSYCHPVQFNWVAPPPLAPTRYTSSPPGGQSHTPSSSRLSSFPCHFCTESGLTYALAGLGQRRVEVIQWDHDPSSGYEELKEGWADQGEERTRMCMNCTMERMIICLCEGHVIRPITGLDPKTFDYDAAMRGVVEKMMGLEFEDQGKEEGKVGREDEVKWCSICIFPAFYECCTRPMFSVSGLPTSSTDDIGCGLLLCEVCASRLMGSRCPSYRRPPRPRQSTTSRGRAISNRNVDSDRNRMESKAGIHAEVSLDAHIATAEKDYFNYPDGLRADVCFLSSTGELMKRLGRAPDAGGSVPRVVSEDEDDDKNNNIDVNHDSHVGRNEGRYRNPLYANRSKSDPALKKDAQGHDFKSSMYVTSDESDNASDANTDTNNGDSPSKKNKRASDVVKKGGRGKEKSKSRAKSRAKPRSKPNSRSRGKRGTTSGGDRDRGIRPGAWGMEGFVDLT